MPKREYVAEDVDFRAIENAFAALDPPKLQLEEVLDRLRDKMVENRKRGVTADQLVEALGAKGIKVSVRELKHFLSRGELPGGRLKKGERDPAGTATTPGRGAGESAGEDGRASVPGTG